MNGNMLDWTIYLNLLLMVGFTGVTLCEILLAKINLKLSARDLLKLQYRTLILILSLTLIHVLVPSLGPDARGFSPPLKFWAAESSKPVALNWQWLERWCR